MSSRESFDALAYLREQLPGYSFEATDPTGFGGVLSIRARVTLTLGIKGELGTVLIPVPQLSMHRKAWADEFIATARRDASEKTGLDSVWDARERQLRAQFAHKLDSIKHEAEARIQREVGKAYLAGKAAGRAEEMAFAAGEEYDE